MRYNYRKCLADKASGNVSVYAATKSVRVSEGLVYTGCVCAAGGKKKPLKAPKKERKDVDDVSAITRSRDPYVNYTALCYRTRWRRNRR